MERSPNPWLYRNTVGENFTWSLDSGDDDEEWILRMLTGSGLFQRSGHCLLTWDVPNLQLRSEQGG